MGGFSLSSFSFYSLPNFSSDLRVFSVKGQIALLGPLDFGCLLLRIILQVGIFLDLLGVDGKSLLGKEMVVRAKELEAPKVVEFRESLP